MPDWKRDQCSVREVLRSAQDDRVYDWALQENVARVFGSLHVCRCYLARPAQAAITRRGLILAMCSRSQWKIASRHLDKRSEISALDLFFKHLASADIFHPPILNKLLSVSFGHYPRR